MGGSREGQGVRTSPPPRPEKLQKYRVSLQYWSGSPEKLQLPIQHSMLGQHRPASETPSKWRFAPQIVVFGSVLPHQTKKKTKKNSVNVGPPLAKLSGSAHAFQQLLHKSHLKNKCHMLLYYHKNVSIVVGHQSSNCF